MLKTSLPTANPMSSSGGSERRPHHQANNNNTASSFFPPVASNRTSAAAPMILSAASSSSSSYPHLNRRSSSDSAHPIMTVHGTSWRKKEDTAQSRPNPLDLPDDEEDDDDQDEGGPGSLSVARPAPAASQRPFDFGSSNDDDDAWNVNRTFDYHTTNNSKNNPKSLSQQQQPPPPSGIPASAKSAFHRGAAPALSSPLSVFSESTGGAVAQPARTADPPRAGSTGRSRLLEGVGAGVQQPPHTSSSTRVPPPPPPPPPPRSRGSSSSTTSMEQRSQGTRSTAAVARPAAPAASSSSRFVEDDAAEMGTDPWDVQVAERRQQEAGRLSSSNKWMAPAAASTTTASKAPKTQPRQGSPLRTSAPRRPQLQSTTQQRAGQGTPRKTMVATSQSFGDGTRTRLRPSQDPPTDPAQSKKTDEWGRRIRVEDEEEDENWFVTSLSLEESLKGSATSGGAPPLGSVQRPIAVDGEEYENEEDDEAQASLRISSSSQRRQPKGGDTASLHQREQDVLTLAMHKQKRMGSSTTTVRTTKEPDAAPDDVVLIRSPEEDETHVRDLDVLATAAKKRESSSSLSAAVPAAAGGRVYASLSSPTRKKERKGFMRFFGGRPSKAAAAALEPPRPVDPKMAVAESAPPPQHQPLKSWAVVPERPRNLAPLGEEMNTGKPLSPTSALREKALQRRIERHTDPDGFPTAPVPVAPTPIHPLRPLRRAPASAGTARKLEVSTIQPGDDNTTVSEVTNPTYFRKDRPGSNRSSGSSPRNQPPSFSSSRKNDINNKPDHALDPFDVNSPAFASGDPFKVQFSPKFMSEPVMSDEFSDPFFPGSSTSHTGARAKEQQQGENANSSPRRRRPHTSSRSNTKALAVEAPEDEADADAIPDPDLDLVDMEDDPSVGEDPAELPPLTTSVDRGVNLLYEEKKEDDRVAQVATTKLSKKPANASSRFHSASPVVAPSLMRRTTLSYAQGRKSAEGRPPDEPGKILPASTIVQSTLLLPPPAVNMALTLLAAPATQPLVVPDSNKIVTPGPALSERARQRQVKKRVVPVDSPVNLPVKPERETINNTVSSKAVNLTSKAKREIRPAYVVGTKGVKKAGSMATVTDDSKNDSSLTLKVSNKEVNATNMPKGDMGNTSRKGTENSLPTSAAGEKGATAYRGRFSRKVKGASPIPKEPLAVPPPPPAPSNPPEIKRVHQDPPLSKPSKATLPKDEVDLVLSTSTEASPTILAQGTTESLSSVGSDIRRLRSILRRSRLTSNAENVRYVVPLESAFAVYDEKEITDPMQRAGLRLLSAAVIPIQSAARRHLAVRKALTRMWSVVVVQSIVRRWLAIRWLDNRQQAAIKIQARVRGGRIRDEILLEHCCAIEIQRHVRGFLSTLRVYEAIYRITLVQSIVRRHQAIEKAMDRMVSVLRIQSVARGYLLRSKWRRLTRSATIIATAWRGFACRCNYQFDLVDIVLVQSVIRRKAAMDKYRMLRGQQRKAAATVIQSRWRSFYCRIVFRQYLAARVIQTKWRCYVCMMSYSFYRSAVRIQSCWRRFVCAMSYRFYVSAVKIQSKWRTHVCVMKYRDALAAVMIQSCWRRYVCETNYTYYKSAVIIQSAWRRHASERHYRQIVAARLVQARWRGYVCATNYRYYRAAVTIQAAVRGYHCASAFRRHRSVVALQSAARGYIARKSYRRHLSAAKIQALWRGFVCATNYRLYQSAVSIQAVVRRFIASSQYRKQRAAILIQCIWRGYVCATNYRLYRAAVLIQKIWRGYVCAINFRHYRAAVLLQTMWRRHVCLRNYRRLLAAIKIQSLARGRVCYRSYIQYRSAVRIQACWRRYVCATNYRFYRSAVLIQAIWRGHVCATNYVVYRSAVLIQSTWRKHLCETNYKVYRSAVRIQAAWRGYCCAKSYQRSRAATLIQSHWRAYDCTMTYLHFLADVLIVQSIIRRKFACTRVSSIRHSNALCIQTNVRSWIARRNLSKLRAARDQFVATIVLQSFFRVVLAKRLLSSNKAAVKIQKTWRGFMCYADYMFTIADIVVVQSLVRRKIAVNKYAKSREEHRFRSAVSIQRAFRRRVASRTAAAIRIQKLWRGFVRATEYFIIKYEHKAAVILQSAWRRFWQFSNFVILLDSAITIQSAYRGFTSSRKYSTTKKQIAMIQKCFRSYLTKKDARIRAASRVALRASRRYGNRHMDSARQVQAVVRGYQTRDAIRLYLKARAIQSIWRGFILKLSYREFIGARRIQCFWRQKVARAYFVQLREVLMADVIVAAVAAQRCYRGYYIRKTIPSFTKWKSDLKLREVSATKVQRAFRGFIAMQKYWHILGSAIQIQACYRGWIQRCRFRQICCHLVTIQSFWRRCCAIKEVKQRAFILMLISNDATKREKKVEPNVESDLRDWEKVILKQRQVDHAVRKIQRFFKMVKAEVDREIQAEKKRRKARKKMKKREDVDDEILENVWKRTIDQGNRAPDIRQAEEAVARELAAGRKSLRPDGNLQHNRNQRDGEKDRPVQVSSSARAREQNMAAPKPRLPTRPVSLPMMVRLPNVTKDNVSDVSGFTATSSHVKVPPSRFATWSSNDIDDDFSLEEAWIDAEIMNAKERRRNEKRSTKQRSSQPRHQIHIVRGADKYTTPPRAPTAVRTGAEERGEV